MNAANAAKKAERQIRKAACDLTDSSSNGGRRNRIVQNAVPAAPSAALAA